MRSPHNFARISAFLALVSATGVAAADDTSHVVNRGSTPWLFVGATRYPSPRAAVNAVMPKASSLSLVELRAHRFGDGDRIVRFGQTHRGLPVVGRGATVRISAAGDTLMTAVDLATDLPATISPTTTASAAAKIALADERDAHLVIWTVRDGSTRLAWAVVPVMPMGVAAAPRVIVDATNGKILERRDMAVFAQAQVYKSNPIKTPTLSTEALALTPTGEHLTNEFVISKNCIDNKTVTPVNLFGFKTNMHTCDLIQTATKNTDGNFVYTPSDTAGAVASRSDDFSEVSMYYHASRAYAFFRGLQGDDTAQVIVDKPLPVVANLQTPPGALAGNFTKAADPNTPLDTFQNAFFSPAAGGLGEIFQQLYGLSTGALWFGQGPSRDYAYDGDVVYHEFTHAVVDDTLKLGAWHLDAAGAVDAPGAMNEGLADYFSSAITGDPDVGEYASKDISPTLDVIRTLANTDKCPDGIIGEVHADSTLFSGALWTARSSLAADTDKTKFDRALYKAMRSNPGQGDLGYEDLAKLFQATLKLDFPAGATALETAMTARAVYPACVRMLEGTGDVLKPTKQDLNGWWSTPGNQTVGTTNMAPGIFQVHQKLAGAPTTLTIGIDTREAGSASPLGGGGTPFTPVILVKFGKAISWNVVVNTSDADESKDPTNKSGRYTADVLVPEGATDVYVQIANKGDTDGYYSNLRIDQFGDATPPAETPPATETPAATPASTSTESGCAVSAGPSRTSGLAGIFLGVAAVLGLARRRGKRTS